MAWSLMEGPLAGSNPAQVSFSKTWHAPLGASVRNPTRCKERCQVLERDLESQERFPPPPPPSRSWLPRSLSLKRNNPRNNGGV